MAFGPVSANTGVPVLYLYDPDIVRVIVNPDGSQAAFPVNPSGTASPVVMAGTGASHNGTVDGTGAQTVAAANPSRSKLQVQNTDPANSLYLSFTNPATVNDIVILPGGSINFDVAPTNALYGLSSAASTKWATMEITT